MVTRDEYAAIMDDKFGGVKGNAADTQNRVRGSDTGPGQEHENYDMLQGINAAVNRIEGIVGKDAATVWDAGLVSQNDGKAYPVGVFVTSIDQKVTALTAQVDALAKIVALLVK